jgi:hypothetical protein
MPDHVDKGWFELLGDSERGCGVESTGRIRGKWIGRSRLIGGDREMCFGMRERKRERERGEEMRERGKERREREREERDGWKERVRGVEREGERGEMGGVEGEVERRSWEREGG